MSPIARRNATIKKPVLSRLVLPGLEPADADQLEAHDSHEGLRLEGADLSGRDLTGATFTECEMVGVTAHTTTLTHARLIETRLERLNAPVLDATRSTWRDVELSGSRLGALDIYDAEVRSTRIVGSKFDWINLRASTLEDVLFEDCTIDELDLDGVTATRVAFVNCRASSIALAHARLKDVDLRGLEMGSISNLEGMSGATLNAQQVTELAPAFASHLGIRIEG
ncbi:MAG: pentapeptide repeat-containing protein [Brachybacterium tyrofermentans]